MCAVKGTLHDTERWKSSCFSIGTIHFLQLPGQVGPVKPSPGMTSILSPPKFRGNRPTADQMQSTPI
jgi:hypothetical protein